MPSNRIYLGVDNHSSLAMSIEGAGRGFYFLTVSTGAPGEDLCKFTCAEEALEQLDHTNPIEIDSAGGKFSVRAVGDQVVISFQCSGYRDASTYALSSGSFQRVLRLARNRAYVG